MALCCRGVGNSGADLRARFECELFEVAVNVAKRDSKDRDHHSSFQSGVYVAFGSRGRRTSIRTAVERPACASNPVPVNPTIRRSAAARCIGRRAPGWDPRADRPRPRSAAGFRSGPGAALPINSLAGTIKRAASAWCICLVGSIRFSRVDAANRRRDTPADA